jgi:polyhydroxyalkanoate synthase
MLGGTTRFILSRSGHIQALVNPPAPDSRSSYRVATEHPADPAAFLEQATKVPGSWWPDYVSWLGERSGALRAAPRRLGGRGHRALGKAPGTYVYAR